MKILILTPIFGRPEVTEIWASSLWTDNVLAILSPEDKYIEENIYIVNKYDISFVIIKNSPLGKKMNDGIQKAYEVSGFDYLMNLDSDGILHPGIIDFYASAFKEGLQFFGVDKVVFFDYKTKDIRVGFEYQWCSGRCISRSLIESILGNGHTIYYDNDERGLDCRSVNKVYEHTLIEYQRLKTSGFPYVLDIKTWNNLNDWYFIQKLSEKTEKNLIKEYFSDELIQKLYGKI